MLCIYIYIYTYICGVEQYVVQTVQTILHRYGYRQVRLAIEPALGPAFAFRLFGIMLQDTEKVMARISYNLLITARVKAKGFRLEGLC